MKLSALFTALAIFWVLPSCQTPHSHGPGHAHGDHSECDHPHHQHGEDDTDSEHFDALEKALNDG